MSDFSAFLAQLRGHAGRPLALATVVQVEGHAFRRPGARMLVDAEGPVWGTVSGGCLEAEVAARGREVLASGRPQVHAYDLRGDLDLVWGSGAGCEGASTLLIEPVDPAVPWLREAGDRLAAREACRLVTWFEGVHLGRHALLAAGEPDPAGAFVEALQPPIALWLYGGGEEARPVVRLAKLMGWRVGVLDHRPAFVRAERFPEADELRAGHPRQVLPGLPLDPRTAWVLMSHLYAKDQEALRILLPAPVGYVGLLGHRARGARMVGELRDEGLLWSGVLHTPVGLDLGGHDPAALALAIVAEVQAAMEGGSGLPLREGRSLGATVRA